MIDNCRVWQGGVHTITVGDATVGEVLMCKPLSAGGLANVTRRLQWPREGRGPASCRCLAP